MSEHDAEKPVAVEPAREKLLGFRHIAAFAEEAEGLNRALDATHNKIGESPPV